MKCLATLCLLICSFALYSQRFSPGYIIQKGDSIHGYIQDKDLNRSYNSCTFKKTLTSGTEDYKPFEIDAYGTTGYKVFASRLIPVNDSTKVRAFAEHIVAGTVNLFIYKGQFFADKDGTISELRITRTIVYQGEEQKMLKRNEYHGILASMFTGCQNLTAQIFETPLSEKHLTALFKSYNNCANPSNTIVFKENVPNMSISIGLSGGYSLLSWGSNIVAAEYPSLDFDDLGKGQSFLAGAFIEFNSPKFSKKLSLRTELIWFNAIEYNSVTVNTTPTPNETITSDVSVGYSAIKVPILIKYSWNTGKKVDPFFNLGPTLNFISEKYNNQILTRDLSGASNVQERTPFTFAPLSPYLTGGIGSRFYLSDQLFLEVEARLEFGSSAINGIEPFTFNTFDSNTMFMFRLGKRM